MRTVIWFLWAVVVATLAPIRASAEEAPYPPQVHQPNALDRTFETDFGPVRVIRFKGEAKSAVMFIHGDVLPQTGKKAQEAYDNETFQDFTKALEVWARITHKSFYLIVRPGMLGSPGEEKDRRSRSHYLAITQAIHKVIAADDLGEVALAGQSGGAMAGMASLILSPDAHVRCAAFQSGLYHTYMGVQFHRMLEAGTKPEDYEATELSVRPYGDWMEKNDRVYDVNSHLDVLKLDPLVEIDLLHSRRDHVVPFPSSQRLYERLVNRGVRAKLIEIEGKPPSFHGVVGRTFWTAVKCLNRTTAALPSR